jgi:hypothetical protein
MHMHSNLTLELGFPIEANDMLTLYTRVPR